MNEADDLDISGYLKSLLEGKSDVYFHAWFSNHSSEIERLLPRAEYLKLKFDPLSFARKRLETEGVACVPNESAIAYQEFLLTFASDLLDEKGDLRRDELLSLFDGIPSDYYCADRSEVVGKIERYLERHQEKDSEILSQDVVDLLYFFQSMDYADPDFSKFGIAAIQEYFERVGLRFSEIDSSAK